MPPDKTFKKTSPAQTSKRKTKQQTHSNLSRQDHEASAEGRSTMHSDPFPHHSAGNPRDGIAPIHPVTAEKLDEAAHKAAELADSVAHHAIASTESGDGPPPDQASVIGADAVEPVRDAPEIVTAVVTEVRRDKSPASSDEPALRDETVSRPASDDRNGPEATLARYNDKVVEIMQSNIAATTALLSALSQAKSLPEAVAINTDHMRRQLDAMTSQSRELASLAQRLGLDALKPLAGILQRGR